MPRTVRVSGVIRGGLYIMNDRLFVRRAYMARRLMTDGPRTAGEYETLLAQGL